MYAAFNLVFNAWISHSCSSMIWFNTRISFLLFSSSCFIRISDERMSILCSNPAKTRSMAFKWVRNETNKSWYVGPSSIFFY